MYALSQLPAHTKCIGFALNTNKCQAEAGEWNLLLGLAHHLTSTGLLDPPCMLPKLPRGSGRGGGGQKPPNNNSDYSSNIKLLGAVAKQITTFLAPARRQREMKEKIQRSFLADSGGGSFSGVGGNRQQQQAAVRAANGSRELLAFPDNNNNNHNNQNNRNNYSIDDDARGGEGKTAAAASRASRTDTEGHAYGTRGLLTERLGLLAECGEPLTEHVGLLTERGGLRTDIEAMLTEHVGLRTDSEAMLTERRWPPTETAGAYGTRVAT